MLSLFVLSFTLVFFTKSTLSLDETLIEFNDVKTFDDLLNEVEVDAVDDARTSLSTICTNKVSGLTLYKFTTNNQIYYFSTSTDTRTWLAAKSYCVSKGMRLAKIDGTTDFTFLAGRATPVGTQYWVAATDILREGRPYWSLYSGASVTETITGNSAANDCGAISTDATAATILTFTTCSSLKPFMCEMPSSSLCFNYVTTTGVTA